MTKTGPQFQNIPVALKALPQWVCFRHDKTPVDPKTAKDAKANDPNTWGSYQEAVAFFEAQKDKGIAGIGFEFSFYDSYSGVDLDKCRDPKTGEIEAWAWKIIRRLDSYSEISPSGTGVHIEVKGKPPQAGKRKEVEKELKAKDGLKRGIEIYYALHYFTMTGHHIEGTPITIGDRDKELNALYLEVFGESQVVPKKTGPHSCPELELSDRELIEKAHQAADGEKFARLWKGDTAGYSSPSDADYALVHKLVFWTNKDHARTDKLFRQSGLCQAPDRLKKWNRLAATTISKAIVNTSEGYIPRKSKEAQKKTVPKLIKNLDIASIYAQETGLKLLTAPPQVDEAGFTPCSVLYCPEDPNRAAFVNIGQGEKRGYYVEMENGKAVNGGNLCKTISEKGFGTAYVTAKDVYAYLKKTTVAKRDARGVGEQNLPRPEDDATKPIIPTTDRYLDSISNDAIKALETANHPPFLFRRSGNLVRVSLDEKNTPKIITLNDVQLRGVLARNAFFMKETKAGSFPTSPPIDAVKDILHLGDWTFPALEGIVQSPVMRPDGTILVEPGYDGVTHLFYVKPADLSMPEIPENPSDSDVEGYLGYILEAIRDFPFVEDSDRANALALIMTLPLRPAIAGSVPMAAITKPTPGTGASLFADIVAIIGTGKVAPMAGLPRDDDEMRKFITSRLLAGDPLICFDNLELPLWGPSLSRALTCHEWEDRILGGNTTARLPQRAVWVANGNNLKLRGDLPRRTFPIRLDAKLAKPWEREIFRHSDLRSWCRRWRGSLLVSILSIGRAWYVAGKPEPSKPGPVLGGFEAWAQTIGGILSFAGVEGFLENLAQFHDEADLEGPEWNSFLSAWVEIIGDTPKTCQEVAVIIRQNSGFASTLPENLQDILQNPEKSFERSLGRALAKKEKRPYGEKSLALQKDRVTRDKVILWKVTPL